MDRRCIAMAAGGLLMLGAGAQANENDPFSANVVLTSDYLFRGISQTQEEPALQGAASTSPTTAVSTPASGAPT